MKNFKVHTMAGAALLAGVLTLTLSTSAFSAEAPKENPEKAQALLEKVKKGELDRAIAAKQTDIDRLKEDLDKSKKDAEALQKTIEDTGALVNESSENLDKLIAERQRLEHAFN